MTLPARLPVKPLSANEAYAIFKGRKIRTRKYKEYETKVIVYLIQKGIKLELPKTGPLYLYLKIGVSSRFDLDNCAKPFIDIAQKYFKFNDNRITYLQLEKEIAKRGEEFIEFQLTPRFIEGERPYLDKTGRRTDGSKWTYKIQHQIALNKS